MCCIQRNTERKEKKSFVFMTTTATIYTEVPDKPEINTENPSV